MSDICDVCAGDLEHAKQIKCICGGTGLGHDEKDGLRVLAHKQSQRIEELEGFINKYDEWAMTKDGSSEEGNAFVEMVEARQVLDKE